MSALRWKQAVPGGYCHAFRVHAAETDEPVSSVCADATGRRAGASLMLSEVLADGAEPRGDRCITCDRLLRERLAVAS